MEILVLEDSYSDRLLAFLAGVAAVQIGPAIWQSVTTAATWVVAKVQTWLTPAAPDVVKNATTYSDPKFAAQLERQFREHGSKSILKSFRSLERQLADHRSKLPYLEYKSSVEREIRTFERQIETIKQFMKERGIQ